MGSWMVDTLTLSAERLETTNVRVVSWLYAVRSFDASNRAPNHRPKWVKDAKVTAMQYLYLKNVTVRGPTLRPRSGSPDFFMPLHLAAFPLTVWGWLFGKIESKKTCCHRFRFCIRFRFCPSESTTTVVQRTCCDNLIQFACLWTNWVRLNCT